MRNCEFDFDEFCRISNEYFSWLCNCISNKFSQDSHSYRKLLTFLHSTPFEAVYDGDKNRAVDGQELRYSYSFVMDEDPDDVLKYLDGECSLLEMMVALALKCEGIMQDTRYGNRTAQWFWHMVISLGLGSMIDQFFDPKRAKFITDKFITHRYLPNGKGGLFTVRDTKEDFRQKEIWYQMMRYLDMYDTD